MAEQPGERLVAVGEDVGLHDHDLADRTLGREPATVDLGRDRLDGHAAPVFGGRRGSGFGGETRGRRAASGGCAGHFLNRAMRRRPPGGRAAC